MKFIIYVSMCTNVSVHCVRENEEWRVYCRTSQLQNLAILTFSTSSTAP